jgi:hypothetical protein
MHDGSLEVQMLFCTPRYNQGMRIETHHHNLAIMSATFEGFSADFTSSGNLLNRCCRPAFNLGVLTSGLDPAGPFTSLLTVDENASHHEPQPQQLQTTNPPL